MSVGSKKAKRFRTHASGWGPGKVHVYLWSYENKVWYVLCRGPFKDPHGKAEPGQAEVTCKRCLSLG